MSTTRQVKFSTPIATRGSRSDSHPRDSGVGSSSSDRTGSSGSPDDSFTAQDYDIQSNNVDALREALSHAIKDIERWKDMYHKEHMEIAQAHKSQRDANSRYREQCEYSKEIESRMEKQDAALNAANARIQDLDSELSQYKIQYKDLHERYQATVNSSDGSTLSGSSTEHSHGSRSYLDNDPSDLNRLKERLNRDADSGSLSVSKSSRSSENTALSSKRTSSSAIKPYIEKMPTRNGHSSLVSPREHGSYSLTTVANGSASRKHGMGSSRRERERGDYVAHPLPLPDRS
ncbi:hypothetical protein F4861DRAFT_17952 [Xylaria intraflava]|nr:hypothetical protein F4861DRAFT_17952 [Xylaria intraflava]